jgi:hypothetical protein
LAQKPQADWAQVSSPEFVQQKYSAKEHAKGNPEVNVGCDGSEHVAGITLGLVRQSAASKGKL